MSRKYTPQQKYFLYFIDMEIKNWIKEARLGAKLTQEQLGDMLGLTKGNISAWEKGRHEPSFNQMKKICELTKHPLPIEEYTTKKENIFANAAISLVPIVGSAKLGNDENYFVELEYPVGSGDGNIMFVTKDANAYALKCVGNSMSPRIKHGEYVVVEPNRQPQQGDEVVVRDKQERVMVKTWKYSRDGIVYFESVNADFMPVEMPEEEIRIMHYVAGIAKSSLKVDSI